MRTLIISLVVATAGCNLYYGSDEAASRGKHLPDAGSCCTFDAGIYPDGPEEPPDAGTGSDAGSGGCHDDGGVLPDAPSYPDAAIYPDAAHH